jgi:ribonuclease P/MRP protein subunit POP7
MAVVRRTLKMLEKPSQRTRSLPLAARMQAVRAGAGAGRGAERRDGDGEGDADTDADAAAEGREGKDDVVLLGTGRAIEKTLQVAAWLQRRGDLRVSLRTGSVGTVDDLVPVERRKAEDGDGDGMGAEEDADLRDAASDGGELPSARVRWLSCMEVGVRMR